MKKFLIYYFLLLLAFPAFANQNPIGLSTDTRVKIVPYDEENIVTLKGNHLISTAIFLSKHERIMNVDIGDQIAWNISIANDTKNVIFIKPILPESNTNMTVLTDKRIYRFHLMASDQRVVEKNATYSIQFKYPDEERTQFQESINNMQHAVMGAEPTNAVSWNYDYSFYGSKYIAPIQAVDNGTFTIFKFAKNRPMPAIFSVDRHRNEALVNFRVQGDYVFVQGIKRQYTLRNGEEVTTVYNDSYRP